ncbi:hypothetical protein FQZ97_866360 [compost metagenome]
MSCRQYADDRGGWKRSDVHAGLGHGQFHHAQVELPGGHEFRDLRRRQRLHEDAHSRPSGQELRNHRRHQPLRQGRQSCQPQRARAVIADVVGHLRDAVDTHVQLFDLAVKRLGFRSWD